MVWGKKKKEEPIEEPEEDVEESDDGEGEEVPTPSTKAKEPEQQLRIITENQLIIGMLQEILTILKK
jgi:hypothetical protein